MLPPQALYQLGHLPSLSFCLLQEIELSQVKRRLYWMTCWKQKGPSGNCSPPSQPFSWAPVVVCIRDEKRVGCSTQLVSLPPFRVPGCRSTRAYAPTFSLHQNLLLLDMVCWDFMMYGCMWHSTNSLCADAIILYPPHHIQSCFLSGGLIYYSVRPVGRYKCFS